LRDLLIELGKPWQSGTNKSVNGKFRDEYLAMKWLYSRAHADVIIEAWLKHYNEVRLHSSLGYKTPMEFMSERKNKSTDGASVSK
jgi:putative transposase